MSRYPSRDVARMDRQWAPESAAEKQGRRDQRRIRELEATLKLYTHCRHASIDCFCTKEAKAVLG